MPLIPFIISENTLQKLIVLPAYCTACHVLKKFGLNSLQLVFLIVISGGVYLTKLGHKLLYLLFF